MFDNFKRELMRHRQRGFLDATMAACALVASADGDVTFSERVRMDTVLESLAQLQIFDPHDAVDMFNERLEALRADGAGEAAGRDEVFAAIRRGTRAEGAAELLLRICVAISLADGDFGPVERGAVAEICVQLGLPEAAIDRAHAALTA